MTSLEHLVVLENKEVLKTKNKMDRSMSKEHRNQVKELPMAKSGAI